MDMNNEQWKEDNEECTICNRQWTIEYKQWRMNKGKSTVHNGN